MFLSILCALPAFAADASYCEIVRVSGDVQLKRAGQPVSGVQEGMNIQKGDSFIVGKASSADLAFDPEWKNTARLNENTRVLVRLLNPARLQVMSGDLYAKLDRLPKGSTFEVATPTALAVARGTKFRTTYLNGHTTVFNDSETSVVYIDHFVGNGNRVGEPITLQPGESTTVLGEVQVDNPVLDNLQEARDRQDQQRLNDDLNRIQNEKKSDNPNRDITPGPG